jgi:hypothetical protein
VYCFPVGVLTRNDRSEDKSIADAAAVTSPSPDTGRGSIAAGSSAACAEVEPSEDGADGSAAEETTCAMCGCASARQKLIFK